MVRKKKRKAKRKVSNHQWVYIMSNDSMPGLLKIGMTTTSPQQRNKELGSATGVPTPFKLEYSLEVRNALQVEKAIHQTLSAYRVNSRREFFEVDIRTAIRTVKAVAQRRRGAKGWALTLTLYALEAASALVLLYLVAMFTGVDLSGIIGMFYW